MVASTGGTPFSMDSNNEFANAEAREYYSSIPDEYLQDGRFQDLDDAGNIEHILSTAQNIATDSFVVDFSDRAAFCAFDLPANVITRLLDSERPESLSTRWINLYHPFRHRTLLAALAKKYDFSPRLFALMASDPKEPRTSQSQTTLNRTARKRTWGINPPSLHTERDLQDELSEYSSISSRNSSSHGNLYKIADEVYHYSSVDLGRAYVCLGYNSLYGTKTSGEEGIHGLLPNCTRIWTWLIICSDNTVISINEDPFPFAGDNVTALQQRILCETKRNLINVLHSLSRTHDLPLLAHDPLTLLPIRMRLGRTAYESAHRSSDVPGLLFYYLFENWRNSYTLVTRRESRYGVELDALRREMYECPKLRHIDRLDAIGRELGLLRRHYGSYIAIVDRLLEPQSATSASLQNSQVVSSDSRVSLDTIRPVVLGKASMLGVSLSSAARVRFRRLSDLLELYALSEVEEYIKVKDSLVTMNFALITIRQSQSVDRLTRITLLLTKATILFLPVSFMTGYFSVPLAPNPDYTVKTFWVSFSVVFALSWLALFLFGAFSGNLQTIEVFEGIGRGLQAAWKATLAAYRAMECRHRR